MSAFTVKYQRIPIRLLIFAASLAFVINLEGCKNQTSNENTIIKCWDLQKTLMPDNIFSPKIETLPPEKSLIWSGTVSHHLLADIQIDRWFSEIAARRNVRNFFIISPSHYGLSTDEWALGNCIWQTKNGNVQTNIKIEKEIAEKLEISFEPQVFQIEHGINTLIPYISKYFPKAKICPIAVHGEPPLNQKDAQKLADALSPYFSDNGKKENFLLISTDFAHHGNFEGTQFKDNRSREFFNNPTSSTWIFCGCDNRPGIYVLSRFLTPETKNAVLFHTNSFELSGQDSNDITSYFFSLFYN